jgi:hypothetical protein
MQPPLLDVGAIATLAYATLDELPSQDRVAIAPVLERALQLVGVKDIAGLQLLRSNGQSVRGQTTQYPQAGREDVANLLILLQNGAKFTPLPDPGGEPVPYDAGSWTAPDVATAPTINMRDLIYA